MGGGEARSSHQLNFSVFNKLYRHYLQQGSLAVGLWRATYTFCTFGDKSIRCNYVTQYQGLEASFGNKRWPFGTLSPSCFGNFIKITYICVDILRSFCCIRFPSYTSNGPCFELSLPAFLPVLSPISFPM